MVMVRARVGPAVGVASTDADSTLRPVSDSAVKAMLIILTCRWRIARVGLGSTRARALAAQSAGAGRRSARFLSSLLKKSRAHGRNLSASSPWPSLPPQPWSGQWPRSLLP